MTVGSGEGGSAWAAGNFLDLFTVETNMVHPVCAVESDK